jgi:hypothetical protein
MTLFHNPSYADQSPSVNTRHQPPLTLALRQSLDNSMWSVDKGLGALYSNFKPLHTSLVHAYPAWTNWCKPNAQP